MKRLTPEQKRRAAELKRARRAANPERARAVKRAWLQAHPEQAEKARERSRVWREQNQRRQRGHQLKKNYGMSSDDYDRLFQAQGGACAICKRAASGRAGAEALAVDHDHQTDEVRGLLCSPCNLGLGLFKDAPELLEAAAGYIRTQTGARRGVVVGSEQETR